MNADQEDYSNTKTNLAYHDILKRRDTSRKHSWDSEGSVDDLLPRATQHKIPMQTELMEQQPELDQGEVRTLPPRP